MVNTTSSLVGFGPGGLRKIELESIDQVLRKFYYNCSHGLRGPMASLEGLSYLLESDAKTDLPYPKSMKRSVEKMKTLIGRFKDYNPDRNYDKNARSAAILDRTALLSQFVFTCSEGLKHPIESLKHVIDTAKERSANRLEIQYLDMADRSLKRIENFAADVEIFAMNRSDKIFKEKIDLRSLLDELLLRTKRDDSSHISLTLDQSVNLITDRKRLKIILQKLLVNALCFRNPQSKAQIDITIKVSRLGLLIKVKDNGIGIDQRHFDKIFSIFWRASNASLGCGLGLYVANQITERLNGQITVKSELGNGSEFSVDLPNYQYFDSVKGPVKVSAQTTDHTLYSTNLPLCKIG